MTPLAALPNIEYNSASAVTPFICVYLCSYLCRSVSHMKNLRNKKLIILIVILAVAIASGVFVFWKTKKSSEGMKVDLSSDIPKVSASFAGKNISFMPVDYKKGAKREEKDGNVIWQEVWEDIDINYEEITNDQIPMPNEITNPKS